MIKSHFIKNIIISTFSELLKKYIFVIHKILKSNNKQKNILFIKLNKKKLIISNSYRYKIKIPVTQTGLKPLLYLKKKNLLNKSEIHFLREAIGVKTLGKPIEEIKLFSKKVCKKFENFFYEESLVDKTLIPKIKLSEKENLKIINYFKTLNIKQINFYNSKIKKKIKSDNKILEIGYSTGGHSLIAFERIGFNVSGIDNFYDGHFKPKILDHLKISEQIKNKINFIQGDISKTNFDEKFDLIYSTSVLEHINNIEDSLKNMYSLLNSNGSIFHNYNPFFAFNGGHALGIGDAPFMHLRLSIEEYKNYIKLYRPYESEIAIRWLEHSMNKKISQERLKDLIIKNGFKIIHFQSNNLNKFNFDISNKLYKECLKNYDFLKLEDLLGHSITFIATKI